MLSVRGISWQQAVSHPYGYQGGSEVAEFKGAGVLGGFKPSSPKILVRDLTGLSGLRLFSEFDTKYP